MSTPRFGKSSFTVKQMSTVPKLGHIYWFEPDHSAKMTFAECRKLAVKAGFPQDRVDKLIPDISPKKAWSLALDVARDMRRTQTVRVMVRPVKETADYTRHQIIYEILDDKGERKEGLKHQAKCGVVFDKEKETVSFDGVTKETKHIEEELKQEFERRKKHINIYTVLGFCNKTARRHWHVTPVRNMGGVWFALDEHTPELEMMEKFFESVGGFHFYAQPVVDIPKFRKHVSQWVDASLLGDLEALQRDFQAFLDKRKTDKKSVTPQQLKSKLESFKKFEQRFVAYESALNYKAGDLRSAHATLLSKVQEALSGKVQGLKVEEKEPKKKAKKATAKKAAKKAKKKTGAKKAAAKKAVAKKAKKAKPEKKAPESAVDIADNIRKEQEEVLPEDSEAGF